MANETIETVQHLNDIGFAEFTADLIDNTFRAVVDANIRQIEAYTELVGELSKSLSVYINDTKQEASGDEVLDFLLALPVPKDPETGGEIQVGPAGGKQDINYSEGQMLPGSVVQMLNQKLSIAEIATGAKDVLGAVTALVQGIDKTKYPGLTPDTNGYYDPAQLTQFLADQDKKELSPALLNAQALGKLYDAVAERIAANKYTLLQEMVRQGLLRLVVEHGLIETRLTFRAWEHHLDEEQEKQRDKQKHLIKTKERRGGGLVKHLFGGGRGKRKQRDSGVIVNTASQLHRDVSGTSVEIFGRVLIHFKTDYQPLAGN